MKYRTLMAIGVLSLYALMHMNVSHTAHHAEAYKTAIVRKKNLDDKLYFTGKLKPISTHNITSPIEGVVVKKYFAYGVPIKKGDLLAEINSQQLAKDFNQSLTSYLTAKDHYYKSQNKLKGSRELLKLGIISKNEYQADESEYNQNHIEYLKAKYAVEEYLKYDDTLSAAEIEKMSIRDFKHIDAAFNEKRRTLKIHSPYDGVALMPESNDSNKKVEVGSQLKLGDVVLSVGDLTGFSTEVEVGEIDVTKIRTKQPVSISGVSFPGIKLEGLVTSVDAQAVPSQGNGVPTFMVKVEIPKLEPRTMTQIKIGMSAEVVLNTSRDNILLVPINAVYEKAHKHYVNVVQNDEVHSVQVKTGQTLLKDVEIMSGLKAGDTVQLSATA